MKPDDVPREAVSAFCQAFWGAYPVELIPVLEKQARATLAAVLPEHERQVRAKVADEIEAVRPPRMHRTALPDIAGAAYDHAAKIARGGS